MCQSQSSGVVLEMERAGAGLRPRALSQLLGPRLLGPGVLFSPRCVRFLLIGLFEHHVIKLSRLSSLLIFNFVVNSLSTGKTLENNFS